MSGILKIIDLNAVFFIHSSVYLQYLSRAVPPYAYLVTLFQKWSFLQAPNMLARLLLITGLSKEDKKIGYD